MRQDEVYRQLSKVYDPELDKSLTELGFIGKVSINSGIVTVHLRLPTFWCAANFAFMMASDIRDRVGELPWVERVVVNLEDHFNDKEINEGVNSGKSFEQTFQEFASGELDELRETFRRKAFYARQERLLRHLLDSGWTEQRILSLTVGDLKDLPIKEPTVSTLVERYLEILEERGLAGNPSSPIVITHDGSPVPVEKFQTHLRDASLTRFSMEFNATFCRGLLQTRYGDMSSV